MKHSYEEFDKPIQELIKLMEDDYPNDFELVINSTGAEIRSTLSTMNFLNEKFKVSNVVKKEVKEIFDSIKKNNDDGVKKD